MIQSLPTTDLAIVAGLAGAAFAVMNALVGVLKETINKRNGRPSSHSRFSGADRVILEQTHKNVEENVNQGRQISDEIADGFRNMDTASAQSLTEYQKQTKILEKLEGDARRLAQLLRGMGPKQ